MFKKISFSLFILISLVVGILLLSPTNNSSIKNNTNYLSAPKEIVLTYKSDKALKDDLKELKIIYNLGIKPLVTPHQILSQGSKLTIKLPLLAQGKYLVKSQEFNFNFTVNSNPLTKLVRDPKQCLSNDKIDTNCLSKFYEILTLKQGPSIALSNIANFIKLNPNTVFTCHDWTHAIGIASAA